MLRWLQDRVRPTRSPEEGPASGALGFPVLSLALLAEEGLAEALPLLILALHTVQGLGGALPCTGNPGHFAFRLFV